MVPTTAGGVEAQNGQRIAPAQCASSAKSVDNSAAEGETDEIGIWRNSTVTTGFHAPNRRNYGQRLPISHIHFGGGTPTIMTPEAFADLVGALRFSYLVLPGAEMAGEIDPRTLTEPIAEGLGYSGVNRASLGV